MKHILIIFAVILAYLSSACDDPFCDKCPITSSNCSKCLANYYATSPTDSCKTCELAFINCQNC